MTPKEKANELIYKFHDYSDSNYGANRFEKNWHGNVLAGERKVRKKSAKQCALIAVDEILKVVSVYNDSQVEVIYFKEVRKEIENL